MKAHPLSGILSHLCLITSVSADAQAIQKTLAHVYPGVEVEATTDEKDLPIDAPFLVVDTKAVAGAALDHLLDRMSDVPTILLVDSLAEVRTQSPRLTGRRAIVARTDLAGMGLIQCVHHLLERQQLHEQLQKTSRHLKELAIRDELTRFYNHRHFDELLAAEVKKATRYKRPLALTIVALKNFTAINEAVGHHEADRILARAAEFIRGAIREVDIPARYGDNEFSIILPESDEEAGAIVGARIQAALSSIAVGHGTTSIPLSTGCGIAALSSQVQSKEELLRTALAALLEAKRNGENAIRTGGDLASRREEVRENRQVVEQLAERLSRFALEAERSYFQALVKAITDFPIAKRTILPHAERVAFFAERLALHAGIPEAEARAIHRAGILHDAGKLAIDAEILTKAAPLTNPEKALMHRHPQLAIQMLGQAPFFSLEPAAILHHHERFDGTGYPDGLSGRDIPIAARVLCIVEAWDTMITAQPYRTTPLPLDAALAELRRGAGAQFDPELVDRFVSLIAG